MAFVRCPRCELNYVKEGEKYCPVCTRELRGIEDSHDHIELCPVCGERPVQSGSELCSQCIREHKMFSDPTGDVYLNDSAEVLGGVDELEELELDLDDSDTPPGEIDEIEREFGDSDREDF